MADGIEMTFDESIKKEILSFLDKKVNDNNLIVEKEKPSQKVIAFDGEEVSQEISLEEFGGIQKGSEVFIKNDLISVMRLSKH